MNILSYRLQERKKPSDPHGQICKGGNSAQQSPRRSQGHHLRCAPSPPVCVRFSSKINAHRNSKMAASHWSVVCIVPYPLPHMHRFKFENFRKFPPRGRKHEPTPTQQSTAAAYRRCVCRCRLPCTAWYLVVVAAGGALPVVSHVQVATSNGNGTYLIGIVLFAVVSSRFFFPGFL